MPPPARLPATLLGISPDEAGAEVPDTVGEITNMIAGTLRGKLAQSGDTLMITPPSVTVGSDFSAQHFNVAARVLCPFQMGAHEVFVELILQSTKGIASARVQVRFSVLRSRFRALQHPHLEPSTENRAPRT